MRLVLGVVAALLLAAPSARAATPLVGIGEQHPQLFTQTPFQELGVENVRFIAAYDALDSDWQRTDIDAYLNAARAAGVKVLLGFNHSRDPKKAHSLPTVKAYARAVAKFRGRYPWVTEYLTWNEANHCSQPTCRNPKRAAQFYLALRKQCSGCKIVAADVLDGANMVSWSKAFQRAVGSKRRVIWGIHNYIDANRFRKTGTKALLKAVKGDLWFTETGGLVKRQNKSTLKLPGSIRHQAKATTYVFKLAALSSRVKRVYFYHWAPAPTVKQTWDSALVDKHAKPRPAYDVLRTWLRKHGSAR